MHEKHLYATPPSAASSRMEGPKAGKGLDPLPTPAVPPEPMQPSGPWIQIAGWVIAEKVDIIIKAFKEARA